MPAAKPVLWIIVPCYNEEAVLPITAPLFRAELQELSDKGKIAASSRVLFVNDGSRDSTWQIIQDLSALDEHFLGMAQSRNRGHQNAVFAGLMEAKDHCDITISIDCDGQDDIHAMEAMVDAYHDGCEIVYGVRSHRDTDTWFKRTTAQGFYRFMSHMKVELIYNHADYRLASSRVLQVLAQYREVNLFLRGMFPLVGFKSTSVYYDRSSRLAGQSHYPLSHMIHLAVDGITSFSTEPMNIMVRCGGLTGLIGLIALIVNLVRLASVGEAAQFGVLVSLILFFAGLLLTAVGIVGIYVGRTYMETKARPRYIISERTPALEKAEQKGAGEADAGL